MGQRSVPVKKLLGEDMLNLAEPKRQSPSVIARLMGLEALPSPKRQQKRYIDSHQYDGRSTRRNSSEHLEFKDVYEDLEAAHIATRCFSTRCNASSFVVDPGMAHVHDKFKEAKHLSAVEKDLLFTSVMHVHEPQFDRSTSLGSYIAVLKPSNSEKFEGKPKPLRSARDTSTRHDVISQMKRQDGLLLEPHNQHRVHTFRTSPKSLLNDTDEESILPTRIVVLKPNLGKTQNACTSPVGSHLCPCRIGKMDEHKSIGGSERVSRRRKDSFNKAGSSMPMSKEAREIAREIARKMRYCGNETMGTMSNGIIGYAGDESLCDPDETDSEKLRMQLQLLKMESGTFEESSALEEEAEQMSPASSGRNHTQKLAAENWEIAYVPDVLMGSGFQESNFDTFRTNWYSRDCPLDPKLFDKLAKKYNDEMGGSKSERRLLFDSINSELLEIFHVFFDLYPWVIPKLSGWHQKLENEVIKDALDKLINRKFSNREVTDIILDREMQWLSSKGEMDAIGNEITRLLIDDMITDVIRM